jgi:tetratricopeptide (TPR) repeat protein
MLALFGLSGGEADTEQLFGAWRTFFEQLAAEGPVVLVFEDLHWADSGMLDFVDYLLEWSRTQPIFILTLARPELIERRPTWGAGKRQFTSVYLEPLGEPAIRELLVGLVPGLPDAASRAIGSRADGIPLYAVETVRMLVADGRLVEKDGVYAPSGDLSQLAVPESLTGLISSRLDALDPEARALAQDASVLGQRFTLAGLAAVSGLDSAALEPRIETLVRRELLNIETDPRSPERNQYGFVQSLIREVSYNTLARRDRKSRHLAAARFFESLGTDELAGALAGQYAAAHANADGEEEAAALAAQARLAMRAAAERAMALGAQDQAFEFYRQALSLAHDGGEEAEMSLRAGEAASSAGRYHDAEPLLRRALELFTDSGDVDASDRALSALATGLATASRYTETIELLEPILGDAPDYAARPGLIAAGGQLARAYMLQWDAPRAIAAADRVLPAAEHADMSPLVADLLVTKGTALNLDGRVRESLALITAGRELGEEVGAQTVTIRALINQAGPLEAADPLRVYEESKIGLALARRVGQRAMLLTLVFNAVGIALRVGDWDWAGAELATLDEMDLEDTDRMLAVTAMVSLRALRGEPRDDLIEEMRRADISEESLRPLANTVFAIDDFVNGNLERARPIFRENLRIQWAADDFMFAVRIAAWLRDADGLEALRHELASQPRHGPLVDALDLTAEAALEALAGRAAESVRLYQEALRVIGTVGYRFDAALIGIDMATLLDHSLMEVQQAVQDSRVILSELRAIPFLERLSSEMARSGAGSGTTSAASDAVPIGESEVAAG